jgi:hypothetical protein
MSQKCDYKHHYLTLTLIGHYLSFQNLPCLNVPPDRLVRQSPVRLPVDAETLLNFEFWVWSNLAAQPLDQKKNFRVESEALDALEFKGAAGGLGAKEFKAALRVINFEPGEHANEEVEKSASPFAQCRLVVADQLALQRSVFRSPPWSTRNSRAQVGQSEYGSSSVGRHRPNSGAGSSHFQCTPPPISPCIRCG